MKGGRRRGKPGRVNGKSLKTKDAGEEKSTGRSREREKRCQTKQTDEERSREDSQ